MRALVALMRSASAWALLVGATGRAVAWAGGAMGRAVAWAGDAAMGAAVCATGSGAATGGGVAGWLAAGSVTAGAGGGGGGGVFEKVRTGGGVAGVAGAAGAGSALRRSSMFGTKRTASAATTAVPTRRWVKRLSKIRPPVRVTGVMQQPRLEGQHRGNKMK